MKYRIDPLEIIAKVEPSFKKTGPPVGSFSIGALSLPVDVHLEHGGWLSLSLPLPKPNGSARDTDGRMTLKKLLELQHGIEAPLKIATCDNSLRRYILMGEIPCLDRTKPEFFGHIFKEIKSGFYQGISLFNKTTREKGMSQNENGQQEPAGDTTGLDENEKKIEDFFKQLGWEEWTRQEDTFLLSLEREGYSQKIEVMVKPNGVVYFTSLVTTFDEGEVSEASRKAISDFLLRNNRRLRLARASIIKQSNDKEDTVRKKKGVLLEVAIKGDAVTPAFMKHALSSLIVAARFTTLEVRALLDERVAITYMDMMAEGHSQ